MPREPKTGLGSLNIDRGGEPNIDRYFLSQSLQVIGKKALVVAKQQVSLEDKAQRKKPLLNIEVRG